MAESPAPLLRRAAALMRARADAATRGPWRVSFLDGCEPLIDGPTASDHIIAEMYGCGDPEHTGRPRADAAHIASWHPEVAKTVASLLDRIAWMLETDADLAGRVSVDETIAIARAYLVEEGSNHG